MEGFEGPGPRANERPAATELAENDDARLKKALDDLSRAIGRSAVNHLKDMYPDALKAVTKTAEISLTNHVRNQINHHMKPVLALLVELKREERHSR